MQQKSLRKFTVTSSCSRITETFPLSLETIWRKANLKSQFLRFFRDVSEIKYLCCQQIPGKTFRLIPETYCLLIFLIDSFPKTFKYKGKVSKKSVNFYKRFFCTRKRFSNVLQSRKKISNQFLYILNETFRIIRISYHLRICFGHVFFDDKKIHISVSFDILEMMCNF